MTIQHQHSDKKGRFYYEEDGETLAEMVYNMASPQLMIIEHTEVNPRLEGKGLGRQLLETLVQYVREQKIRVIPLCTFAKATFNKVPEWQDVLK